MYRVRAAFVGEFDLADGSATAGWSRQALSQSGRRWLGTDIAQPGMSDERQKSRLCGRPCIADLAGGRRRLTLNASEARRDVAMLVIFWDLEQKVLTYLYSGSVVRFRSACCGRPDPYAQDVSAVCTIKRGEMVGPSVTRRVAESMRYGSDQVQGRHPYLVTRAAVLGVGGGVPLTATLHAHKSRDKGV